MAQVLDGAIFDNFVIVIALAFTNATTTMKTVLLKASDQCRLK